MNTDKIYGLFAGEYYYPKGGAGDFIRWGSMVELKSVDLKSAVVVGRTSDIWAQIVEPDTMQVVEYYSAYSEKWTVKDPSK